MAEEAAALLGDVSLIPAALGWRFGPFTMLAGRRVLLRDGKALRLGGRAFDLLEILLRNPGQYQSREALTAAVWPHSFVEASSLRAHVTALRRALGSEQTYIQNQPGLGYAFIGVAQPVAPEETGDALSQLISMPSPVSRHSHALVGREAVLQSLRQRLGPQRLVSLVGPAGIGKTSVAQVLAPWLTQEFTHGVCMLDLGFDSAGSEPLHALAEHLGCVATDSAVATALREQQMLLVLDHCESAIDTAASRCEAWLQAGPGIVVLAVSREPLRLQGEQVLRLAPLEFPPEGELLNAERAQSFTAVQLFVQRAAAGMEPFALTDHNAQTVGDICRRLDGVPLALEMAAASVSLFGVQGVLEQVQSGLSLRAPPLRGGQARQQSLQSSLDWSFEKLSPVERQVLEALSVFCRSFSLDAALAVAADESLGEIQVCDGISTLVAKSLLAMPVGVQGAGYRLLDMTRAYVEGRRVEGAAWLQTCRRHAQYFQQRMAEAEQAWAHLPLAHWVARYHDDADDVRAALSWAFSAQGDLGIALPLVQHSSALWFHLARVDEYHGYLSQALAAVAYLPDLEPQIEMRLNSVMGAVLCHLQGSVGEMRAAFERASAIASIWANVAQQQDIVWGLWLAHAVLGETTAALALAEKYFEMVVQSTGGTPSGPLAQANTLMALAHLHAGGLGPSRQHTEAALQIEDALGQHANTRPERPGVIHLNRRVAARTCLAQVLWQQGLPEQALRSAHHALEDAAESGHILSTCFALSGACTVALWAGEWTLAKAYTAQLAAMAEKHQLRHWLRWAECYEMGVRAGLDPSFAQTVQVQDLGWDALRQEKLATFNISWANRELLVRMASGNGTAAVSELLRAFGEQCLTQCDADALLWAERYFERARETAQQQGARGWELRATISLARLWRMQNRVDAAYDLLRPVLDGFTEGHGTMNLQQALNLLQELDAARTVLR